MKREKQMLHVYPPRAGHITEDGVRCWCGPRVEHHPGGTLIIHRAVVAVRAG